MTALLAAPPAEANAAESSNKIEDVPESAEQTPRPAAAIGSALLADKGENVPEASLTPKEAERLVTMRRRRRRATAFR